MRALLQLNDNLIAEHRPVRGILGVAERESVRTACGMLPSQRLWRGEGGIPLPACGNERERFLTVPRTLEVDPFDPVRPRSNGLLAIAAPAAALL